MNVICSKKGVIKVIKVKKNSCELEKMDVWIKKLQTQRNWDGDKRFILCSLPI